MLGRTFVQLQCGTLFVDMPVKNRNKIFKPETVYHIYNRGIDGREVFSTDDDYEYFKSILELYLLGPRRIGETRFKEDKPSVIAKKEKMNLKSEVEMLAYCLMPDHFHFMLKQKTKDGITKFMRRVFTKYVMYYNRKLKRHGPLFENIYRGIEVDGREAQLHLSRFIHLNPVIRKVRRFGPVETVTGSNPEDYKHSSYNHYIGLYPVIWVHNESIKYSHEQYRSFVESYKNEADTLIKELMLDS